MTVQPKDKVTGGRWRDRITTRTFRRGPNMRCSISFSDTWPHKFNLRVTTRCAQADFMLSPDLAEKIAAGLIEFAAQVRAVQAADAPQSEEKR